MPQPLHWRALISDIALETKDSKIGGNWKAGEMLPNGRIVKSGDSEANPVNFLLLSHEKIRNYKDLKRAWLNGQLSHYFGPLFIRTLATRLVRFPSMSGNKLKKLSPRIMVQPNQTLHNIPLNFDGYSSNASTPRGEFSRFRTYGQGRSTKTKRVRTKQKRTRRVRQSRRTSRRVRQSQRTRKSRRGSRANAR